MAPIDSTEAETRRGSLLRVIQVAIGLWVLLSLVTFRDLASGPRVGSPWSTYGYGDGLLFHVPVQQGPLLVGVLFNLAAFVVGYRLVVKPLWGRSSLAPPLWLGASGIVPGSLLIIALSRVTTLLLPNGVAPFVLLTIVFVTAGAFSIESAVDLRSARSSTAAVSSLLSAEARAGRRAWLRDLAAVMVVLGAALVFSVHLDRSHAAGEGSVWFIDNVFLSPTHGVGTGGHWPILSQHYDEAAFLYPVVHGTVQPGSNAGPTLLALYWITLGFTRLGMLAITYVAVRSFRVDKLSALLLVAFLCGASLSLNPLSSRLLFDSLSPLIYTLHIGRFLAPVLPALMIAAATGWQGRATPRALVVAAWLGVGLSALPIHLAVVIAWAAVVGVLTAFAPTAARSPELWRRACLAGAVLIGAFSVAYGLPRLPVLVQVGALVLGSLIAGAMLLVGLWKARRDLGETAEVAGMTRLWAALGAGYAAGLMLFGNVLAHKVQPLLSGVWPWSAATIVDRLANAITNPRLTLERSPYCADGYYWGFRTLTGHCGSLAMFARTYGLPIVVTLGFFAWWLRRSRTDAPVPARTLTSVYWGIAVALLAMPASFVLFDFVSGGDAPIEWQRQLAIWLRSRLIEPWFYSGALLALALFLRESTTRQRRLTQSLMLVGVACFGLSPLIIPAQLVANFAYLFSLLR